MKPSSLGVMRILHVPYSYYPDPAGGTEVYVKSLAHWQRSLGCDVAVAAPAPSDLYYEYEEVPVWRFGISSSASLRELYGEGDRAAAESFAKVLDRFAPDVLHIHAFTGAVSVLLAREAARRGIPVIFNYHTPTVSCPKGTLLRWEHDPCDGDLRKRPCVACTLNGYGVARPLASVISWLPVSAARRIGDAGLTGGVWTAVRMPELVDIRNQAFRELTQVSDRVVALCEWTRELLLRNGVASSKIALCRQGISWTPSQSTQPGNGDLPLRMAFMGRLDATKGTQVLVQALKENPELPVQLDLFGIRQGDAGDDYAAKVQRSIVGDPRIRVLPAIPSHEVVPRLREYDLLAVPSQWLETGPLVVLEAFAAGVPVLGSNLGGIAELVRDRVDGILVAPPRSPEAWAAALRELCLNPGLLPSLRAGIRPPRHQRDVALELMPLYERVAGRTVCP